MANFDSVRTQDYDDYARRTLRHPDSISRRDAQILCLGALLHKSYVPNSENSRRQIAATVVKISKLYGIKLERTAASEFALAKASNLIKKNILHSQDIDLDQLASLLGSAYVPSKDACDSLLREYFDLPSDRIPVLVGIFNLFEVQEVLEEIQGDGPAEAIVSELGDVCWAVSILGAQFGLSFHNIYSRRLSFRPDIRYAHLAACLAIKFMQGEFNVSTARGLIEDSLVDTLKGVEKIGKKYGANIREILAFNMNKLGKRYGILLNTAGCHGVIVDE